MTLWHFGGTTKWHFAESFWDMTEGCDLVFFDPDNGMEVKSKRVHYAILTVRQMPPHGVRWTG